MPTYDHLCEKCKHEWEDVYKMSEPVPNTCPSCKEVGGVKRLISAAAPGKVELYGKELAAHLYSEGKKIKNEILSGGSKSINILANVIGEDKFHQNQLIEDRLKRTK